MDPVHPITPGPLPISQVLGRAPVERPQRVTRERDRPAKDPREQARRRTPQPERGEQPGDEEGPLHIDVRV